MPVSFQCIKASQAVAVEHSGAKIKTREQHEINARLIIKHPHPLCDAKKDVKKLGIFNHRTTLNLRKNLTTKTPKACRRFCVYWWLKTPPRPLCSLRETQK